MTQKILVRLVDDLDNDQEADETLTFTVDNVTYEMDLSAAHAEEFRTLFEPYTDVARRIAGRRTPNRMAAVASGSKARAGKGGTDLEFGERASLRAWAGENGFHVADRGRIAASVIEAWREAGSPAMD